MRRAAVVIAGAVALLAVLAFVGRWEGDHNVRAQNARMRVVWNAATSDGLLSSRAKLYRLNEFFDCIAYAPRGRPQDYSAYELCFDRQGRLVQTIDRHSGTPVFSSVLEEPSRADLRVPVPVLYAGFKRLGICEDHRLVEWPCRPDAIPTTNDDQGLFLFGRRAP